MQNIVHEKTSSKRWLALIAISLGVFMALIDTTVVNVALTQYSDQFECVIFRPTMGHFFLYNCFLGFIVNLGKVR